MRTAARFVAWAGALLCLAQTEQVMGQGVTLEDILGNASVEPPASVNFVEQRFSSLFETPLEISGRMELLSDGGLRKVITSPTLETVTFDGNAIIIERNDGSVRTLNSGSGQLRRMLEGMRALLTGNRSKLLADFQPRVSGVSEDWRLVLTPIRHSRQLRSIMVEGNDRHATRIVLDLGPDERSDITLLHGPSEP